MSKPVKNLIAKAYEERFGELTEAVVIDIRGVKSNDNNALRGGLAQKNIKVTVVKNSLAKQVFDGTAMQNLTKILDGPCALAYGAGSAVEVARALIERVKDIQNLQFKGAIMDGQVFGPDQIEALSKYPTRDEAVAQVVQVILGPASQIAGCLVAAGGQIASILKTIEEKLEKGEEIKKAG
jgi:large subunit ribosomal protein L10